MENVGFARHMRLNIFPLMSTCRSWLMGCLTDATIKTRAAKKYSMAITSWLPTRSPAATLQTKESLLGRNPTRFHVASMLLSSKLRATSVKRAMNFDFAECTRTIHHNFTTLRDLSSLNWENYGNLTCITSL